MNTIKEMSNAKSNLYERAIFVNGHKVNGLIDTGSGCTLLQVSVVEKYKLTVSVTSDKMLRGFAGQIATSNRSVSCEIRIMDATARVDAVVISNSHLIYDIIVGRDFLEQEDIVTIKRGNDLVFKRLPAIGSDVKHIVDINFLEKKHDDIAKYTDNIRGKARQQCTELLQQFKDCISFSIADLGKTNAAALSIRCTTDIPDATNRRTNR